MRGEPTDRLPWAPRMDLWSIALNSRGQLPEQYQGRDTVGIARELGTACHAVRADFTQARTPEDLILRGVGFDNHPDFPYQVQLRDLPFDYQHDAENQVTTFHTACGDLTTHLQMTAAMKLDGISLPFHCSFAIDGAADFDKVACIFDHLEVIPAPERYGQFHARIGEEGVAVAAGPIAASPMHLVLHELVAMDQFFYLYVDAYEGLVELAERMTPVYEAILETVAGSDAEVVFWGANYDQDLTWPPFFAEHIAPWLRRVSDRLHRSGKLLLTHTDGENQGLLPLYGDCRFDVAESVCPEPMTRCTLAQLREGMGDQTTVWGGIPSVALLPDAMDEAAFEAYFDKVFAELGTGERLILGVSDNVPPDADLGRLRRLGERVEAFGPVRPAPVPGAGGA